FEARLNGLRSEMRYTIRQLAERGTTDAEYQIQLAEQAAEKMNAHAKSSGFDHYAEGQMSISISKLGFGRTEISRLLITYAQHAGAQMPHLALFIRLARRRRE